jgi:multiple sugar transport system permease protein
MIIIYTALILGALTMLYPFLLMVSHSISSDIDMDDYKVVPRYLYNDTQLYKKYISDKYDPRFITDYNDQYGTTYGTYKDIEPPTDVNPALVDEWFIFKTQSLPLTYQTHAFKGSNARTLVGRVHRRFQEFALAKYGSLDSINHAYQKDMNFLRTLAVYTAHFAERDFYPVRDSAYADWLILKAQLPQEYLVVVSGEAKWARYLQSKYKDMIGNLNQDLGTNYTEFIQVPFSDDLPQHPVLRELWGDFVRNYWPFRYCQYAPAALPLFQEFLKVRHESIAEYNKYYGTAYTSFSQVPIPADFDNKMYAADWGEFAVERLPLEYIKPVTTERLFRVHLLKKHGSIDGINRQLGTAFTKPDDIKPPYFAADWLELMRQKSPMRVHYITRNYTEVIDYIVLHGRALLVTVIFISVIIFTQLTVNPLCAYALSRFNLSYSFKIILFLLVTMAFPAEVTMIPNFLLMKQLHMLNTFWALFLPGMANGFFIFILKGYFDSLPPELYEAATIDGASELTVYWKITFPMARPVMAWMTLTAFMSAYGAFMFAMIICQDSNMWTLMVWIYEMQNWAPPYLVTAAITVSAIPSLLVFTLCQNVIMRGMVLPVST